MHLLTRNWFTKDSVSDEYATCLHCGSYLTANMRELETADGEEQVLYFVGDVCKHCDLPCDKAVCSLCVFVRYGRVGWRGPELP